MKDWRKMLEGIGGYDNELIGVPSGGVKEMVDDIEYLQRQLANAIKQNVLLKEAVDFINGRISFSSEEFFRTWSETVGKALDATADLSGLVVCDAKPVGDVIRYGKDSSGRMRHGINWFDPNTDAPAGTQLYLRKQS